ncbi:ef hand protein [Cystoisospora suis]|uniref:Ef hand protein n=1 Tax=Cystoisospora suis TaxID=483139 RepID=A0A2C6KX36_9APIC|nr:ef hand protein [Cystoisospora suis]
MGSNCSTQAPHWVAPAIIAPANGPLTVIRRLPIASAVSCIARYRGQAQTLHVLDAGSLEDLCDEFVSECKQFGETEFRQQLIDLLTSTPQVLGGNNRSGAPGLAGVRGSIAGQPTGSAAGSSAASGQWNNDATSRGPPAGEETDETLVLVDGLSVFSAILLLSDGPLKEKVEHCVHLLCWTQQPEVEPVALFVLLVGVVRGTALLRHDVPPSMVLLCELISRLEKSVELISTTAKFGFEGATIEQPHASGGQQGRSAASNAGGSALSGSLLPPPVIDMLQKYHGQIWEAGSIIEALANDPSVQAYHDRITQVFSPEQIEERVAQISTDYKQMLRRFCHPEAYRAEQRASAQQHRQSSVSRSSRMSKQSNTSGGGHLYDLVPLSWKQVNVLVSCCGSKAINTRLLDEMQFEACHTCHDMGIAWKKWEDEPIQETGDDEELLALAAAFSGAKTEPPPANPPTPSSGKQPIKKSGEANGNNTGSNNNTNNTAGSGAPGAAHPAKAAAPNKGARASIAATGAPQSQTNAPTAGGQTQPSGAGGGDSSASPNAATKDGAEGEEEADADAAVTVVKPTWKFIPSSGPFVWSDDVQLFLAPLLAFGALDFHGEGVIPSRHLDCLMGLLKKMDPIHGGFYSRLEKVLAADTRALFNIPFDVPDPFNNLKEELSPAKSNIRILNFAIVVAVCAAIQDRRQHETTLNNRFRRFDVDKSGFILRSDLEVLLCEIIRKTAEVDETTSAVEQALQSVVEKYMNLFAGPSQDRVDYATFVTAHDRIRKNALKLRSEILELASMFEPDKGARRESRRQSQQDPARARQSASSSRLRAPSMLRKNSKMKGSSKSVVGEDGMRSLFKK